MRFFNTAGPNVCSRHYCIPPLERLDLPDVLQLIEQMKYFVLHAPRQTGKTTCLLALMEHLNETGRYRALYANIEAAQAARENVAEGMRAVLAALALSARSFIQDTFFQDHFRDTLDAYGPHSALSVILAQWVEATPLPTVLFLDEVDALVGDTLIALLRQLRAGYATRPAHFPQSIILCGVRDVRDYRIHSDQEKAVITGGSAFNIKAESLRLGDFTRDEVECLYAQHTAETGQRFEPAALDAVWECSCGQPWVANALGYEVTSKLPEGKDRNRPITGEMVIQARENLILRRETHLDQLTDKLREERVRRVIQPLLAGEPIDQQASQEDIQYVTDLGLIRHTREGLQISNGTYREVIPRELTYVTQLSFENTVRPAWYIDAGGRLDMAKLLTDFQEFFRMNSEHWVERFDYKEAGPHLLLQAYLQRVINGGGRVEREYGLGRKRTDLLVIWPVPRAGEAQKIVLELKVLRDSPERTLAEGLAQTAGYMDGCGAREGHLVVFDRDPQKPWDARIYRREESFGGHAITVWGM